MTLHHAPITADELQAVYDAERRPDDPPLHVLALHAARYGALLGLARARRDRLHGVTPQPDLPIPAPWPAHVGASHPGCATHGPRAQCAPVLHLRRRSADNDGATTTLDAKSLAAGAGCER